MKKSPVAASSDLDGHISANPRVAHGVWNMVRPLIAATIPAVVDTPTDLVSAFTWDDAWHDMDLSAYTSATARWAIMAVGCRRTIGNYDADPQFGKYGGTTAYITLRATNADDDMGTGSVVWIPMDSAQRFSYRLPSNDTSAQRVMNLLGYV